MLRTERFALFKWYLVGTGLGFVCLLLVLWGIPRLFVTFSQSRIEAKARINQLNDGQNYTVDLATLLGSQWYNESVDVSFDQYDAAGWDERIAGSVRWAARNNNDMAYVKYIVYTYTDGETARERYTIQEQWVIEMEWGVPVSRQQFPNRPFEIAVPLHADEYRAACSTILGIDLRCEALFHYGNHVAYLDTYRVKDGIEFIPSRDLEAIFSAIDAQFQSS